MDERTNKLKLSALWQAQAENGEKYLRGPFMGVLDAVIRHIHKDTEKSPDYRLYFVPRAGKDQRPIMPGSTDKGIGLWANEARSGNKYMKGSADKYGPTVLIYKNGYKTEAKQPDYFLYITERPKENQGDAPQPSLDIEEKAGF